MGTWGLRPFDNDDAGDMLLEIEDEGISVVIAALEGAARNDDYLEAPEGCRAVAAAALIAVGMRREPPGRADVTAAMNGVTGEELAAHRALAVRALNRVLADDSEVFELWEEVGEDGYFLGETEELRDELAAGDPS